MAKDKTWKKRIGRAVRQLCSQIHDQAELDRILLQIEDPFQRKQMFDVWKPALKFRATFPTPLQQQKLLVPNEKQLTKPGGLWKPSIDLQPDTLITD